MPKATLLGHPVHPMLIALPAGLLPFSTVLDGMFEVTGNQTFADAAALVMIGGTIGGLAAGATGAMDYYEIKPGTDLKRTANLHGLLNLTAMGLFGASLFSRRRRQKPSGLSVLLGALGSATVVFSAWYGGHMVYSFGMRVKGVSPIANAPDLAMPGDERAAEALEHLAEAVPSGGILQSA